MTVFANKTQLAFEPRANVDLGTAAVAYTTPTEWRHSMGGVAAMNGVTATLKYKLERSGGAADVVVELRVKTGGGQTIHTETKNVAAAATVNQSVQVDVGAVSAGSPLFVEVEVTTADAGTTATLDALMQYETPIVVAGC